MARILIVEDDPVWRELTIAVLQSCGHEADGVANGVEALDAVDRAMPDAVVTDLYMPVMDGIELILTLRRQMPQMPIIAISGEKRVKVDMLRMAQSLGANRILTKPFREAEFRQAVEDALLA